MPPRAGAQPERGKPHAGVAGEKGYDRGVEKVPALLAGLANQGDHVNPSTRPWVGIGLARPTFTVIATLAPSPDQVSLENRSGIHAWKDTRFDGPVNLKNPPLPSRSPGQTEDVAG
jgi:hypothetical protein